MELYVLIQSSREILPTLAEIMHRPHNEIASKYERVHEAFNIQYMEQAKRYVNGGDDEDESYMRARARRLIPPFPTVGISARKRVLDNLNFS